MHSACVAYQFEAEAQSEHNPPSIFFPLLHKYTGKDINTDKQTDREKDGFLPSEENSFSNLFLRLNKNSNRRVKNICQEIFASFHLP